MCGITGIYNLNSKSQNQNSKLIIEKMTDTLVHRGPDDEGYFIDKNIALGHRRLSIIDLTKAGHQPMKFGDFIIVYNGEIYNYLEIREELIAKGYQFKTRTDTEVILAAYQEWGEKCLSRFNGMWAFAIYDVKKNELFCSRDRLGVKPFYYYQDHNQFIFASEIKALLAHPQIQAESNNQIIYDYLTYGFTDHSQETFFKNICQLSPAHYIKINKNNIIDKKYWDIEEKPVNLAEGQLVKKFQELFRDAVNLRLRSDVAVGSCLSGGLDSSSIVAQVNALLREQGFISSIGKKQKTFSSIYSSQLDQMANEKKYIDLIIQQTEVSANFIEPNPKKLIKDLEHLIYLQDEPFGSTSIYAQYNVFRLAHQKKTTVILDGQGADETLAGYLPDFGIYLAEMARQKRFWQIIKNLWQFRKLHPNYPLSNIFKAFGFIISQIFFGFCLKPIFFLSQQKNINLLKHEFAHQNFHVFKMPNKFKNWFKNFNWWQVSKMSLPSLLHWEDRNSMGFSVESRVPFLDYRLVEFIFSLPDDLIIRDGKTKYILREALHRLLPEAIYNRHDKIGFATPEARWLTKNLKPEIDQILASPSFQSRPYWIASKVQKYWQNILTGKEKFNFTIWRFINLELWLRKFIDKN